MALFRRSQTKQKRDREKSKSIPVSIPLWTFRNYDGQQLLQDAIVARVDALARNIAKMELKSVMRKKDQIAVTDLTSDVARVLKHPNPHMTQYDFLYKIAAMYFATNNVFIWPQYEGEKLVALWPINYQTFNIYKTDEGTLIAQFYLAPFKLYTVPYSDIIHLRNHFFHDELYGDDNTPLNPVGELLNAQSQGIVKAIQSSAFIRGLLKAVQVLKDEDLRKAQEKFVADNLSARNNGGVIAIDGKFDYKDLESKPYVIDAETRKETENMVDSYFGTNEDFVQNGFKSEGYEAIYEGRIEPFSIMLTQALTVKLFTEREQGLGNEVEANMAKLKYQPMTVVTKVIDTTKELGLFTRDEYREMLGYQPLGPEKGGDEIMIATNNYESMSAATEGDESNE